MAGRLPSYVEGKPAPDCGPGWTMMTNPGPALAARAAMPHCVAGGLNIDKAKLMELMRATDGGMVQAAAQAMLPRP